MDFSLSEEHLMIQSLARDFVNGQLKPLERDLLGRAADISDARESLSPEKENELVKTAMETGLWNAGVPEEFGGGGLDTLGICLVEEELGQTVVPFRFGDVSPVLYECNEEQKKRYLEPALRNEKKPYLALFESESDAVHPDTMMKAEPADGGYILDGLKYSLSRAWNDYFAVVFARTAHGLTCFLVDRDTPGFSVKSREVDNGWRVQVKEPLSLLFENCLVRAENILGEVDKALHLGKQWLQQRRIVRSARSVGMGRRLLEEAVGQAANQQAFGQPAHQRASVQAALADIAVQVHSAALTVYEAAWKADIGKPIAQAAAVARVATTQMLHTIADHVSHIVSGPAFTNGLPMERLCRRVLQENASGLFLRRQRAILAGDIIRGISI